MIIRSATLADFASVFPLIKQGLSTGVDWFDEEKLAAFVKTLDYAALAIDGECVGYIGGVVNEHPWLNRAQLTLMGWYAIKPGAGLRLLRHAVTWAKRQPNICSVLVTVNDGSYDTMKRYMTRYKSVNVGSFLIGV